MSSENLDANIEDEESDLNQETHNDDSRRVRTTPQGESRVHSSTTEEQPGEEKEEDDDDDEQEEEDDDDDDDDDDVLFSLSDSSFFFPTTRGRRSSLDSMFDMESGWEIPLLQRSRTTQYTPLLSLFDSIFSPQMDRLILDEVSSESMQTYHQELLRKTDDIVISNKYPIVPFTSSLPRNHECFICMERFNDQENVIVLDCQHIYHPTCIQNAIAYNTKCPLCKQHIDFTTSASKKSE